MSMKKLAASLVATFALVAGTGFAAADTQKAEVSKTAIANFNDHTKDVVLKRNLDRDIQNEPVLVKKDDGRYLVHEPTSFYEGGGVGKLQSYNKDALVKKFGPLENIRTLDQYKADAAILKSTPGLGPKLADNAFDMGTRLKDIQLDLKAAGETLAAPTAKNKPSL